MPFGRVQEVHNRANGILEVPYGVDARGNGVNARGIESQTIEKGAGDPVGTRFRHVFGIGRQNKRCLGPNGCRHGPEGTIFLVRRCQRQRPRSRTGTPADFAHGGGYIA